MLDSGTILSGSRLVSHRLDTSMQRRAWSSWVQGPLVDNEGHSWLGWSPWREAKVPEWIWPSSFTMFGQPTLSVSWLGLILCFFLIPSSWARVCEPCVNKSSSTNTFLEITLTTDSPRKIHYPKILMKGEKNHWGTQFEN